MTKKLAVLWALVALSIGINPEAAVIEHGGRLYRKLLSVVEANEDAFPYDLDREVIARRAPYAEFVAFATAARARRQPQLRSRS